MTSRKKKIESFEFEPIGYLETCFKEKFGVPRQPGMVNQATGKLKLRNDANLQTATKLLETFSHLWLVFVFHKPGSRGWKPSIRPPRLGGSRKVGVLASRSPHRPNPIGLSAVEIIRIDREAKGGVEIYLRGVDLLDGTPILDIKPYIPYADSIPQANTGWADLPTIRIPVGFTEKAESILAFYSDKYPNARHLIIEILELDPRPAFQRQKMPADHPESEGTSFGFRLLQFDVKWEIRNQNFLVTDLVNLEEQT